MTTLPPRIQRTPVGSCSRTASASPARGLRRSRRILAKHVGGEATRPGGHLRLSEIHWLAPTLVSGPTLHPGRMSLARDRSDAYSKSPRPDDWTAPSLREEETEKRRLGDKGTGAPEVITRGRHCRRRGRGPRRAGRGRCDFAPPRARGHRSQRTRLVPLPLSTPCADRVAGVRSLGDRQPEEVSPRWLRRTSRHHAG
jgi:hypothetical protein